MDSAVLIICYFLLLISVGVLFVVLAIRFVKAHERGALALQEIARQMERANRGPRSEA